MSVNRWINKMWQVHIHTMEYYSAMKRNEAQIDVTTWVNLENITKKPDTNRHILYDPNHMKYPEQAGPQRQKVDQQLPKTGGKEETVRDY